MDVNDLIFTTYEITFNETWKVTYLDPIFEHKFLFLVPSFSLLKAAKNEIPHKIHYIYKDFYRNGR